MTLVRLQDQLVYDKMYNTKGEALMNQLNLAVKFLMICRICVSSKKSNFDIFN